MTAVKLHHQEKKHMVKQILSIGIALVLSAAAIAANAYTASGSYTAAVTSHNIQSVQGTYKKSKLVPAQPGKKIPQAPINPGVH